MWMKRDTPLANRAYFRKQFKQYTIYEIMLLGNVKNSYHGDCKRTNKTLKHLNVFWCFKQTSYRVFCWSHSSPWFFHRVLYLDQKVNVNFVWMINKAHFHPTRPTFRLSICPVETQKRKRRLRLFHQTSCCKSGSPSVLLHRATKQVRFSLTIRVGVVCVFVVLAIRVTGLTSLQWIRTRDVTSACTAFCYNRRDLYTQMITLLSTITLCDWAGVLLEIWPHSQLDIGL